MRAAPRSEGRSSVRWNNRLAGCWNNWNSYWSWRRWNRRNSRSCSAIAPRPSYKADHMSGVRSSKPGKKTARELPKFALGEQALLTYQGRRHRARALVTIIRVRWSEHYMPGLPSGLYPVVIAYEVRSEHGGELTVSPGNLRPGTILDRIAIAVEDDQAKVLSDRKDRGPRSPQLR